MARLTEDMLEEGRNAIRRHDIAALEAWIERNGIVIKVDVVRTTFTQVFRSGDTERALRLFNAAFTGLNPTIDRIVGWAWISFIVIVLLGLLGGLMSLIRAV